MTAFDESWDRSYFFDDGLKFECTQCGACCTGAPGLVRVSWSELDAIASLLGVSSSHLLNKNMVYPFEGAYKLHEAPADGRCVFFENNRCQIYEARPLQCRTWPFWFGNMRSKAKWLEAAACCPGIGQGRLFTKEEILALINL